MSEEKASIEQLREVIATLDERIAEAKREAYRWQNVANQWHVLHDKRSAEVVAAQAEAADLRAQVAALTPPEVADNKEISGSTAGLDSWQ